MSTRERISQYRREIRFGLVRAMHEEKAGEKSRIARNRFRHLWDGLSGPEAEIAKQQVLQAHRRRLPLCPLEQRLMEVGGADLWKDMRERYRGMAVALAARGGGVGAEELLQEAMAAVWVQIRSGNLTPDCEPHALMPTILRRMAARLIRGRVADVEKGKAWTRARLQNWTDAVRSDFSEVDSKADLSDRRVIDAVARLAEPDRTIVRHWARKMTIREIATSLELPPTTVHRKLKEAISGLCKLLNDSKGGGA